MTEAELRELDARVHREVMGKQTIWIAEEPNIVVEDPESPIGLAMNFGGAVYTRDRDWLVNDWYDPDDNREVPRYSSDIAAAWLVVEKMRADGWLPTVEERTGRWVAKFESTVTHDMWSNLGKHQPIATTAPLAICLAALTATGAGKGEG